jgi:3-oxoacyl-[acyl-carrier protein] reductase
MLNGGIMLVTGTSRGIGKAIAQHFSSIGVKVIGCSRSDATFDHENYRHYSVDLTVEKDVRALMHSLKKDCGGVDVLISNVGLSELSVFTTVLSATTTSMYEKFVSANLTSAFYICRDVSKMMIRRRYGRIIAISSIAAVLHQPGTGIYAATKAAVTEMIKIMARELAPVGVTCNVIAPGLINTEFVETLDEEWRMRILSQQTIPQLISTADICHAIAFLASKDCSYLTGQVIDIGVVR